MKEGFIGHINGIYLSQPKDYYKLYMMIIIIKIYVTSITVMMQKDTTYTDVECPRMVSEANEGGVSGEGLK